MARGLPPAIADALGASYLLRLHAVDDPALRVDIARRVASGELRGDAFKRYVAEHTGHVSGGPPRRSDAELAVAALERLVQHAREDDAFTEPELHPVANREKLARRIEAAGTDLAARVQALRAPPAPAK